MVARTDFWETRTTADDFFEVRRLRVILWLHCTFLPKIFIYLYLCISSECVSAGLESGGGGASAAFNDTVLPLSINTRLEEKECERKSAVGTTHVQLNRTLIQYDERSASLN